MRARNRQGLQVGLDSAPGQAQCRAMEEDLGVARESNLKVLDEAPQEKEEQVEAVDVLLAPVTICPGGMGQLGTCESRSIPPTRPAKGNSQCPA